MRRLTVRDELGARYMELTDWFMSFNSVSEDAARLRISSLEIRLTE